MNYSVVLVCYNCGHRQNEEIPVGTSIPIFVSRETSKCTRCECSTLGSSRYCGDDEPRLENRITALEIGLTDLKFKIADTGKLLP